MIHTRNLSFGYSRKNLLFQNLTLSLEPGSIYGLLGKNGAGKSTLLKNLAGLLFPTSGTITVNGFEPRKRQPSFLETIYFIPEETYVPALGVGRYLDLFAPFYPKFDELQFREFLEALGVKSEGRLTGLSFGQQKKFLIAFGLACNTQVLLLDEPTNGLDIPSKSRFRQLLASAVTPERAIIISTHQVRDLDNLIDRVIIVGDGDVLLSASVGHISDKLCFKTVSEIPAGAEVLYAEKSLRGTAVVLKNTDGEESSVNLEQLFNGVTDNPELAKHIFNN